MIKQPMIDYLYKSNKYSKTKKELIKQIVDRVFKKYYLTKPDNLEDATLNFLGTIEISIDLTKKLYGIKND